MVADSICWECANAYVHKCIWMRDMKQVWTKAKIARRGDDRKYYVYIVQECRYFVPEKRRIRIAAR